MSEDSQTETLTLTQYDKITKTRDFYQNLELPEFDNLQTVSLTRYSKNTESSQSNSLQSLSLTQISKSTVLASNVLSEGTLSLTNLSKITIQKDKSINFGRRSF